MPETRCRSCAEPIEFRRTPSGRMEPISLKTQESHFIDCPQRREWRKRDVYTQPSLLGDGEAPAAPPERTRTWEG